MTPCTTISPTPERLAAAALAAVKRLQNAGYTALWAGGCVRDILMGQTPKDYDIATDARPDAVLSLFPHSKAVGKAFGVVLVCAEDVWIEIATFRTDHAYQDGRRPEGISFTTPEHDAHRRDFTVNALFYDPVSKRLLDYVDGQRDLQHHILRCVGNPAERFTEDYLRMLRAIRFMSVLDFTLEEETASAIRRHATLAARISPDRVRTELSRILTEAPRPGDALLTLHDTGLLQVLLPEIAAMKGQAQPPQFHPEGDVFQHTALMLNLMTSQPPTFPGLAPAQHPRALRQLAFAILLHDVGKPPTARDVDGRIRFDRHAVQGANLSIGILKRLHFSNADAEAITYAVANHMRFMDVPRMRRATTLRLVTAPTFPLEIELHRLDCLASHGDLKNVDILQKFTRELAQAPKLPSPWITGHDIMAMGIPEGPEVGTWHKKAFETQLEGTFNDRKALLSWLKQEIRNAPDSGRVGGSTP